MIEKAIERLQYLCDIIPPLLLQTDDAAFSEKPHPGKWSKKEIIGHLVDSATNNHHRFVRAQFEEIPTITYDQNKWNAFNFYNLIDGQQIISFWTIYNKQLVELMKHLPQQSLTKDCNTGGEQNVTLQFLMNDYVDHLEHHVRQVVEY